MEAIKRRIGTLLSPSKKKKKKKYGGKVKVGEDFEKEDALETVIQLTRIRLIRPPR